MAALTFGALLEIADNTTTAAKAQATTKKSEADTAKANKNTGRTAGRAAAVAAKPSK